MDAETMRLRYGVQLDKRIDAPVAWPDSTSASCFVCHGPARQFDHAAAGYRQDGSQAALIVHRDCRTHLAEQLEIAPRERRHFTVWDIFRGEFV